MSVMDMYEAIKPLYYLSKCTGIAPYTLILNRGFVASQKDKLISLIISVSYITVCLIYVSFSFGNDDVATVLDGLSRVANLVSVAASLFVMHRKSGLIITSIENIIKFDGGIGWILRYASTRKMIVRIFMTYLLFLLGYVIYDIWLGKYYFLYNFSFICYTLYYYSLYVLNMSVLSTMFLLTVELRKRFTFVNKYVQKKSEVVEAVSFVMVKHRELRQICKHTNDVFQASILGRLLVSSITMMYILFNLVTSTTWSNSGYSKMAGMIWFAGHVFEIVAVICCFRKLHKEVTARFLSLQFSFFVYGYYNNEVYELYNIDIAA